MGSGMMQEALKASIEVKERALADEGLADTVHRIAEAMTAAFRRGNKVLLCGNGGSAADAQHIAAELAGRFYLDRPGLFAVPLHGNSSYLTAVSNDYSFDETYARLVEAMGREGDILVGISTSGNSPNVVKALHAARAKGMVTAGLTGNGGGAMRETCDYCVMVPSEDTPRIQEVHITVGHVICEMVEAAMFGGGK